MLSPVLRYAFDILFHFIGQEKNNKAGEASYTNKRIFPIHVTVIDAVAAEDKRVTYPFNPVTRKDVVAAISLEVSTCHGGFGSCMLQGVERGRVMAARWPGGSRTGTAMIPGKASLRLI